MAGLECGSRGGFRAERFLKSGPITFVLTCCQVVDVINNNLLLRGNDEDIGLTADGVGIGPSGSRKPVFRLQPQDTQEGEFKTMYILDLGQRDCWRHIPRLREKDHAEPSPRATSFAIVSLA